MSKIRLPKWVRRAIFSHRPHPPAFSTKRNPEAVARHKTRWRLILNRWLELEQGFVPAVEKLPDLGKQYIFDCAISAMRNADSLSGMRQAREELVKTNRDIQAAAEELAALLRQARQLREDYGLNGTPPSLWDALESACELYPEWAYVCKDERRAFLCVAKGQSRPGPKLDDLLESSVWYDWDTDDVTADYPFNIAIHQKTTSAGDKPITDKVRLLIHSVTDLHHPDIPRDFKPTDAAIACLAEVLFNLPPGSYDEESIRGLRRRMVDESLDDNGPESLRRFSILRY